MKALLITVAVGVVAFFGMPMLNEMAANPCEAHDKLAWQYNVPMLSGRMQNALPMGGVNVGQVLRDAGRGKTPKPAASEPVDPMAGLTCTVEYWKLLTGVGKTI